MRVSRVIWIVLIVAVASVLGLLIASDTGRLRVDYAGWVLETSLWAGLAAVSVLLGSLYAIFRLIAGFVHSRTKLKGWLANKHLKDERKQINRAFELEFSGNTIEAIRMLVSAAAHSQHAVLHYQRASELADRIGANDKAREFRQKVSEHLGEVGEAIAELNQAVESVGLGNDAHTMQLLLRLLEKHPNCAPALQMVIELCMSKADWVGALEYLDVLDRLGYASEIATQHLQIECWKARLNQSDAESITNLWKGVPRKLRGNHELIEPYVRALKRGDLLREATRVIEKSLERDWSSQLVNLYGVVVSDAAKQIEVAKSWLKDREHDSDLLLTIARLHHHLDDPESATHYLTLCVENGGGLEAYLEIASMNLAWEKTEQVKHALEQALTRFSDPSHMTYDSLLRAS